MFAEPLASQSGLMLPSESDVSWGTHLADLPFLLAARKLGSLFCIQSQSLPPGEVSCGLEFLPVHPFT